MKKLTETQSLTKSSLMDSRMWVRSISLQCWRHWNLSLDDDSVGSSPVPGWLAWSHRSLETVPGSYHVADKLGSMIFDSSVHYTTNQHCGAWVFTMCHHMPEPHLSIAGIACLASLWNLRRCLLTWNNQLPNELHQDWHCYLPVIFQGENLVVGSCFVLGNYCGFLWNHPCWHDLCSFLGLKSTHYQRANTCPHNTVNIIVGTQLIWGLAIFLSEVSPCHPGTLGPTIILFNSLPYSPILSMSENLPQNHQKLKLQIRKQSTGRLILHQIASEMIFSSNYHASSNEELL